MQQQEELELIRRIVNGETDLYALSLIHIFTGIIYLGKLFRIFRARLPLDGRIATLCLVILLAAAAAGCRKMCIRDRADPYSYDTFSHLHVGEFTLVQKQFTTHRAVFLHAAWLVQTCVH